MKDETGRDTRTWSGISLAGAELEISELVAGGNSVVIKLEGNTIMFDLPAAKLVDAMAAAARHLREHYPKHAKLADQIDREVEMARRDQARFGTS
jgi:hypothetical protein